MNHSVAIHLNSLEPICPQPGIQEYGILYWNTSASEEKSSSHSSSSFPFLQFQINNWQLFLKHKAQSTLSPVLLHARTLLKHVLRQPGGKWSDSQGEISKKKVIPDRLTFWKGFLGWNAQELLAYGSSWSHTSYFASMSN